MSERTNEQVLDEAAHWMMRLRSGEASEVEVQAFIDWQDRHPQHAQVFRRLDESLDVLQRPALRTLRDEQVISALNTPSSRRRFLRGSLAGLALAAGGAVLLRLDRHGLALPGDLSTGTGERRAFELADGSQLTLNARSRVSPDIGQARRHLRLHQGTLLLAAVGGAPAMAIHTPTGRLDVEGAGRLLLGSQGDGVDSLTVLDAGARLYTADGLSTWVEAGQNARFSARGLVAVEPGRAADSAWLGGRLEAENRPLGELIEALRPYRHGVLRISPEAARLRASGLYPLDDTSKALRLLEDSLPIRITRYSDYWVSIDRAA